MLKDFIVVVSVFLSLIFLFGKKIRTSNRWHATVTPLASIIGSGFLVSAPLMLLAVGHWAPLVMLGVVLLAYSLGSSLRFNIMHAEPFLGDFIRYPWINRIEELSRLVLGVAYIISVAFYLKLLSKFALTKFGFDSMVTENVMTTAILLFIGIIGKTRGLSMLELLATYSVNIKLAIIFSALAVFAYYNIERFAQGAWALQLYQHDTFIEGLRKVMGMLIIIQGFETSRYLGAAYSQTTRIQTMRRAQWISGVIYVLFVTFSMVVFNDIHTISETTIIDLCEIVAPVLPVLLIVAAIMSQFSAAVADTVGSGGLLEEATSKKLSSQNSYLLLTVVAVVLIWLTNIFQIITVASKAFMIYYAFQLFLSLMVLKNQRSQKNRVYWLAMFFLLFVIMLLVIIFGIPVE